MEARVRECANEDSEPHRKLHRQASEHKLELRRAEESGYARGLADASAPVEIDERAKFVAWWTNGVARKVPDTDRDAETGWAAWQARAALGRKP